MAARSYDTVVVGGGPSGATAASDLAAAGVSTLLIDKPGRIKPCGGAIPPKAIEEFAIPDSLLVARAHSARIVSPSAKSVDMPINGGFVGMVDREVFDEWLRVRAAENGAERADGKVDGLERLDDGRWRITYRPHEAREKARRETVHARTVIGADGANSTVVRHGLPGSPRVPFVFAYHEIVASPQSGAGDFDPERCDIYYRGDLSPDFYSWIFPHGGQTSVGTGTARQGFSLRGSVEAFRRESGLAQAETIRCEGAPIPLKPLKRWDDGDSLVVVGDAAGIVAPASGEGIYYAMSGGRYAADAVRRRLETGDSRALASARKRFMRAHGKVFWILGMMQHFWYASDKRRERFVAICADPDVQHLTWEAYMHKRLVRAKPAAHMRIFFKDMAHLLGLAPS